MTITDYAPLGYYVEMGDGRYMGAPVSGRSNTLFGILIDWDNDHIFSGSNEWRWLVPGGLEIDRGREFFVRSDGSGFERIGPGLCTLTFDNSDGRYDPRNVNSPLYPYLLNKTERDAWLFVKNGDSGNQYDLITGRMVDFKPSSNRRGVKTFKVVIKDTMHYLNQSKANVDIQADIDTDAAIGRVLDDISWPWGRSLDIAIDTIPWWWVNNRYAYPEIMDIAESELGIFYIAANGDAIFLNRFYSDDAPMPLNGAEISPEIGESQPSETVRDKVILRIHPRVARATSTVWTLQDLPLFVAAGIKKTFFPEFTYENRPVPIQNPLIAPTTDYTMFVNSNGTGTNLTTGFTVVYTPFGQGGMLEMTNNSGSDGYIITTKMRGDALDSPDAVRVQAGDGENVMEIDLTWQQKVESGQDSADFIHGFLSNPDKYFLTIAIEGNFEKQFSCDLFRWIDLTIAHRGISDLFRITKIRHRLPKRRVMTTTFWLEPVGNFAVSNETQLSFQLPARLGEPP